MGKKIYKGICDFNKMKFYHFSNLSGYYYLYYNDNKKCWAIMKYNSNDKAEEFYTQKNQYWIKKKIKEIGEDCYYKMFGERKL